MTKKEPKTPSGRRSLGLQPRHHTAIRMHMARVPKGKIAQELGVAPATISHWFARPDFKARLRDLEAASDELLLDELRVARRELFDQARKLLKKAFDDAHENGAEHRDYAAIVREHVNLYKIIAAQTGVAEMKTVKVTTDHLIEEAEKMLDELLA